MTEWRQVSLYPDYEASDDGRVRRIETGHELKQLTHQGYRQVSIFRDRKRYTRKVHRLVLLAFRGVPEPGRDITRHLDGNAQNNHLTNLAWGTTSENLRDAVRHGTNWRTAITHCPQGHPYSAENTEWNRGHRHCRICRRDQVRRQRARARTATAPTGDQ